MKSKLFPKGSEWRIWDLHVHSPASDGVNGGFDDFVIQLGNSKCDVIGINDYFSVAGYKIVQAYLDGSQSPEITSDAFLDGLEKLRKKKLIPVVECRMANIVQSRHGGTPRINFHIIFDDNLPVEEIESFVKSMELSDNTRIGSRYGDRKFLLADVQVDFNKTVNELRNNPTLKDSHLIWIPYDEYGGIDEIDPVSSPMFKQELVKKADILGSSNKKQSDFFLWKDKKYSEEQYLKWFKRKKPCVKGSDSHSLKDPIGNLKDENSVPTDKFCWIKADPTFQGLKQIVHEPQKRVFIGELPTKLEHFESRRSNYLASIEVQRVDGKASNDWFDVNLEINHDMVAVIGNKGNGKSALLDIIALAGNARNSGYFSFLSKGKFREKGGRLAEQFEVRATWADGTKTTKNLNDDPDPLKPEKIRYLPQSYLEKICTETSPGIKSLFQTEIKNVIFSHIERHDRLEKESLDDLIDYHDEEIQDRISRIKAEIRKLNFDIVKLEERAAPITLRKLELELVEKKEHLRVFDEKQKLVPAVPAPPEEKSGSELSELRKSIEDKKGRLEVLDREIEIAHAKKLELAQKQARLGKILEKLKSLDETVESSISEIVNELALFEIDVKKVISYSVDTTGITTLNQLLSAELVVVNDQLNPAIATGWLFEKSKLNKEVAALQKALDEPSKRYQTYQGVLKAAGKRRIELIGDETTLGTIEYISHQIKNHKGLPSKIENLKLKRTQLTEKIHSELLNIQEIHKRLFSPLSRLIGEHPIIKEQMKLSFHTSINAAQLVENLFEEYIRQDVVGTFQGKEDGMGRLEEALDNSDLQDMHSVTKLARQLEDQLLKDHRQASPKTIDVEKQFRKGKGRKEIYDYLWSLEYLNPEFSLQMDGKDLSQLSPGERGLLLLVFFLLLDKGEIPIVIDQPEENLDNQTVFSLLAPAIQEVKTRRQVIMVTHSPNIAVVCDAEQIILSEIDRTHGNKVKYESGSIESYSLNQAALDVLEGTLPSFKNRGEKYYAK
ncbi:TrlF family AAA-like ATPase [Pseudohalocynthiibacter sp. F2068]|uniref:TrlF family AAA-like ATPase n=1 Tax=Pseudohalocynthiibacter sp. F2068 TaxID=2926418 RepID=UPI001FF2861C|nr:hypothetical protein [Pseudohalocynthiibacter sp. F2068]MCK0103230.1 hypothetical protein [Pseudohalocynthiibacter sp. F2068]